MKQVIKSKVEEEDKSDFWISIADLFFALMMVFIVLFCVAMTGMNQDKIKQQEAQSQVSKKMSVELKKQKINASVDDLTGQVKISNLELFDVNSYTLSEKGKTYLNKFVPIYVNAIFSNPDVGNKVLNIVVQGHTDSQTYAGITSREGQFIKNMNLSLLRAEAVAAYLFQTGYNKKYKEDLIKTVVAEGKSFTDPIIVNGKEDFALSRRVELKLVLKDKSTGIQDIMKLKQVKN